MKNHDLALSVLKELEMIADRDLDEHLKSFVSRAHKFVSTVKASKKLFVESQSSPKKFGNSYDFKMKIRHFKFLILA